MTQRPRVLVVGAGAAGTMVALHLVRTSARRGSGVDVVMIDPADRWGRGTAFGTTDDSHLLNVPTAGMSALPEDPAHFVAWRRREEPDTEPYTFASRRQYGRYLDETLAAAMRDAAGSTTLQHVRRRATALRRTSDGVGVALDDGAELLADAAVIATGLPAAGHEWAPESLARSAFFVPDPWAPGALDVVRRDTSGPADVMVVGTGLTMVDVVLTLTEETTGQTRAERRVHAISRHGRLPHPHAPRQLPAAIPDIGDWGSTLDDLRQQVRDHLDGVERTTGDWRPAMDGLRFRVAELWSRLDESDRTRFLADDAGLWNTLRHRMAPESAPRLDSLRDAGRFSVEAGQIADAAPLPTGGLSVTLLDGTCREVGWVINCTGPRADIRLLGDPLLDDLLTDRPAGALAQLATAGMGLKTVDGRVIDAAGHSETPLWTLGALRRGELWESTAVPEIRSQALSVATAVLDQVAPLPRRLADGRMVGGHHPIARPRDPLGLPISTTTEAAAAYNTGLERLMRLQAGAEVHLREAVELDPDFAAAHAALAMLGHEAGASCDVHASLAAARRAIGIKGDDRERSLVDVVGRRVHDVRNAGATALMNHIALHPRDVLAVSAAVPTIAFSGVTDVQREAWELVEGLAPAYGDHWWYISLLAFTRQDQSRFDEGGLLAESALSCEPASGHAVHALTHVFYETGEHETGRTWLDHWVTESGRSASHGAHFSWHAALHELALGNTEDVRRRYYSQLAPPAVDGVRLLIDTASLVWRWQLTDGWEDAHDAPPIGPVIDSLDAPLLSTPQTPFVAMHAAFAHAAAQDLASLTLLAKHCRDSSDPVIRTVVADLCSALTGCVEERWDDAISELIGLLPGLVRVGGSAAQRDVVEETLLLALLRAGRASEAAAIIDERLDRRPSPLDSRRRTVLQRLPVG